MSKKQSKCSNMKKDKNQKSADCDFNDEMKTSLRNLGDRFNNSKNNTEKQKGRAIYSCLQYSEKMQKSNEDNLAIIDNLKTQIAANAAKSEELSADNNSQKENFGEMNEESSIESYPLHPKNNEELTEEKIKLENTNEQYLAKINELENLNEDYVAQINKLENTNEQYLAKINELENSNEDNVAQINELENRILGHIVYKEQMNNAMKDLQAKNDEINKEFNELKTKMDKANQDYLATTNRKKETISELEQKIGELELKSKQAQIANTCSGGMQTIYMSTDVKHEPQLSEKDEIKQLKNKATKLETENDKLKAENIFLKDKCDELDAVNIVLNNEVSDCRNEITKFRINVERPSTPVTETIFSNIIE